MLPQRLQQGRALVGEALHRAREWPHDGPPGRFRVAVLLGSTGFQLLKNIYERQQAVRGWVPIGQIPAATEHPKSRLEQIGARR